MLHQDFGRALIRGRLLLPFFVPNAVLIRGRRVFVFFSYAAFFIQFIVRPVTLEWQTKPVSNAPLAHTSQMKEALNVSSAHSQFLGQNQEQSENLNVLRYVSLNMTFLCFLVVPFF